MLPALKTELKVVYEDGLYHGTPQEMLAILQDVPASASQVLLVGHNPELESFALDLISSGPKQLKDRIEAKYPTAALAVMRFLTGAWKDVGVNSGKLELFLTPADVERP